MKTAFCKGQDAVLNHFELPRTRFGVSEERVGGRVNFHTLLVHGAHPTATLLKDSHDEDRFHWVE